VIFRLKAEDTGYKSRSNSAAWRLEVGRCAGCDRPPEGGSHGLQLDTTC